jgi:hypothetical protein
MLRSRDLIPVEVKRRHATQQKVSRIRTTAHELTELSGRDAHVFSYAFNFVLSTAFQFRQCRPPL